MLSTLLVVGVISHLWCAARLVGIAHHSFYSVYIKKKTFTINAKIEDVGLNEDTETRTKFS